MMFTLGEVLLLILGIVNLAIGIFTFCNVTITGGDNKND